MFNLMPRERAFYDYFNQQAANVHEGAKVLSQLLENYTDIETKAQHLKNLEHAGDEITHAMFDHLARSFVTPLDREDIHDIASRLDDIIDLTDSAANRMVLYRITEPTEDVKELGRVLVTATSELCEAFALLHDMKKADEIMRHCINVHTQENEGDRILQHAMGAMFSNNTSAIEILKWKDIYYIIETATDVCEDVANVLHTIVTKQG
jgi:uncharacterized protein